VTTSSCAGRASVFLEGRKHRTKKGRKKDNGDDLENERPGEGQAAVPGGKGMGGRWLFISHEPVRESGGYLSRIFGLEPIKGSPRDVEGKEPNQLRFARFQFEPMVRDPHLRCCVSFTAAFTADAHVDTPHNDRLPAPCPARPYRRHQRWVSRKRCTES